MSEKPKNRSPKTRRQFTEEFKREAIHMIRSIFRYGYDAELMEKPVRFGPGFKKPTAKTIRKVRTASGPKMFMPTQVNAILEHAMQPATAICRQCIVRAFRMIV